MWIFLALVVLALPLSAAAQSDWTGAQIFHQIANRHLAPYEMEAMELTLIDRSGNRELREVRRFTRLERSGEFRHLLVFDLPPEIRGVALLIRQPPQGADEQWLYLPAFGKVMKRIASGGIRNEFMGTDYAYEDLVVHRSQAYRYERRPDQTIDGIPCYVLDSYPRDARLKKASGYRYRRLWVRQDLFFIMREEYYDRRGRLFKRQAVKDLVNIGGNAWRANSWTMENIRKKHRTLVRVVARKLDESSVPEEIFRPDRITSGRHVR
jgi:outer membrane lipoprotein-sorting protein